MIMPAVQKPHWNAGASRRPAASDAARRFSAKPSMVVTLCRRRGKRASGRNAPAVRRARRARPQSRHLTLFYTEAAVAPQEVRRHWPGSAVLRTAVINVKASVSATPSLQRGMCHAVPLARQLGADLFAKWYVRWRL